MEVYPIITQIHEKELCRLKYTKDYQYDKSEYSEYQVLRCRYDNTNRDLDGKDTTQMSLSDGELVFKDWEIKKLNELKDKTVTIKKRITKVEIIEIYDQPESAFVKNIVCIPIAHFMRIQGYIDQINNSEPEKLTYEQFYNETE